jgi:hypothetical protein
MTKHVTAGLASAPTALITAHASEMPVDGKDTPALTHTIQVSAEVKDLREPATLCIAITQSGLAGKITRGENAGRSLKHDHVVRVFHTQPITQELPTGSVQLTLPSDCPIDQALVVVFVEESKTMKPLGLASTPVVQRTSR